MALSTQHYDPRWNDSVTATPAKACIGSVAEIEPLLRNLSFYDDLAKHKARNLTKAGLRMMVENNHGWSAKV